MSCEIGPLDTVIGDVRLTRFLDGAVWVREDVLVKCLAERKAAEAEVERLRAGLARIQHEPCRDGDTAWFEYFARNVAKRALAGKSEVTR